MALTNIEVKKDLELIFSNLNNAENSVPSPIGAVKVSAVFPMLSLLCYALSLGYIVATFTPPDDVWVSPIIHYLGGILAFSGFTLILALAIVAMFYTPSLVFLSIPENIREKSILASKFAKTFKNLSIVFIAINAMFAVVCAFIPDAFYGAPVVLLMSYLIMQAMISSEMTRYGMSAAIEKLSKLVNKI